MGFLEALVFYLGISRIERQERREARLRQMQEEMLERELQDILTIEAPQSYGPDPETEQARRLVSRLSKNITVDRRVFDRCGVQFKCHMVQVYDCPQLNFELFHTEKLAKQVGRDCDFIVKANVYDAGKNLLGIEEAWVEYDTLRSGYAADYFFFADDFMSRADSVYVYAVEPLDEEAEEEELKQKVIQTVRRAQEQSAAKAQTPAPEPVPQADKTPEWKRKETWEDYPVPDYDATHTYCLVTIGEQGNNYWYRTRNPDIQVGDRVFVPVGRNYRKQLATVVSMRQCLGREAPYPLERTKHIIGKAE